MVTTVYSITITKNGPTKTKDRTSTVTKPCPKWTKPICAYATTRTLTTTYQAPALSTITSTVAHEPEGVLATPLSTIITSVITTDGTTNEIESTIYATLTTITSIFGYPVYSSRRTRTTTKPTTTSTRTTTITPSPTATTTITLFSLQQEAYSPQLNGDTAGLENLVSYERRLTLQIARPWRTWKYYINSTDQHLYELSTGESAYVDNDEPFGAAVFVTPAQSNGLIEMKVRLEACGQRLRYFDRDGDEFWLLRELRSGNQGEGYYYSTDPVAEGGSYLIAVGPTDHSGA